MSGVWTVPGALGCRTQIRVLRMEAGLSPAAGDRLDRAVSRGKTAAVRALWRLTAPRNSGRPGWNRTTMPTSEHPPTRVGRPHGFALSLAGPKPLALGDRCKRFGLAHGLAVPDRANERAGWSATRYPSLLVPRSGAGNAVSACALLPVPHSGLSLVRCPGSYVCAFAGRAYPSLATPGHNSNRASFVGHCARCRGRPHKTAETLARVSARC
jgi:hypothetical protein